MAATAAVRPASARPRSGRMPVSPPHPTMGWAGRMGCGSHAARPHGGGAGSPTNGGATDARQPAHPGSLLRRRRGAPRPYGHRPALARDVRRRGRRAPPRCPAGLAALTPARGCQREAQRSAKTPTATRLDSFPPGGGEGSAVRPHNDAIAPHIHPPAPPSRARRGHAWVGQRKQLPPPPSKKNAGHRACAHVGKGGQAPTLPGGRHAAKLTTAIRSTACTSPMG